MSIESEQVAGIDLRRAPATTLHLSTGLAEELLAHARAEQPIEACGIVSGSLAASRAARYHPARNAASSPLRYDVDPEDLVRIVFDIERAGEDLVAIFHSHTRSSAVPSASDRREAAYPAAFYLIASLQQPSARPISSLRAWRMYGGHTFEVALRAD